MTSEDGRPTTRAKGWQQRGPGRGLEGRPGVGKVRRVERICRWIRRADEGKGVPPEDLQPGPETSGTLLPSPPRPPVSSLPQSLKLSNAGKTIDGGCLGQDEETECHGLPITCECRNEPDSNNALSTSHHCHCMATESGDGHLRSFVKRQEESE